MKDNFDADAGSARKRDDSPHETSQANTNGFTRGPGRGRPHSNGHARAPVIDFWVISEVLRALARGLSIPQAAADLDLGVSTVRSRAQRLYEKLGVSDRTAAVVEGMRRGYLQ